MDTLVSMGFAEKRSNGVHDEYRRRTQKEIIEHYEQLNTVDKEERLRNQLQEKFGHLLRELYLKKGETRLIRVDVIVCPGCGRHQRAEVTYTQGDPWPCFVHVCTQCDYTITESEWTTVI